MAANINRSKNAARNIFAGALNRLLTVMFPFFIRTLMIKVLGAEYLGFNSLFSSILQVLSLAELGIGSAVTFSMYKPIAEGDHYKICALYNLYRKMYRIIGTIMLILGLCILPFIPNLIGGTYPADINIYLLYLIYLFNTIISYWMFAYKECLLTAYQRIDISYNITSISTLIMYILQILALLYTSNYYVYIIVLPLSTIIINLLRAHKVNQMFPDIHCKGKIAKEERRDLLKRVIGLLLFKISGICRNSFDSIVVSTFLGLYVLAKYQNYYSILVAIIGILGIFTDSITASIGDSIASESIDKNHRNYNTLHLIINWLSGWCTVCLLCLYQPFIDIWIGSEYLFPFGMVILFCIYFYAGQLGSIASLYRQAAGLWWEDKIRPIIEALANLILNIIVVKYWGVAGVLISTIITIIFINIPWTSYTLFKYYFKKDVRYYLLRLMIHLFPVVLASIVTYLICLLLPNSGFSIFVLKLIICVFIPNIIFLAFYHKGEEFKAAKDILLRALPKQKIRYMGNR